ncbi:MAG TPA: Rieske (2Fe-2S) protein [Anaerolineae bacterium]
MNQPGITPQSNGMQRRNFIQWLLGFSIVTTIGGIVVPIVGYLLPKPSSAGSAGPVDVGKTEDFAVGTSQVVSVNDKPVIIVNTKAGGVKAFSAICTHLGCIAGWDGRKGVIHCPCHDGFFNPVTGAVISGPPPRGLAAYEVSISKEGRVLVGKALGQLYGG